LTSLCSVYLRYAPIRSGCGHGSSLRLATKRYEKSGLGRFPVLSFIKAGAPHRRMKPHVRATRSRTLPGGSFYFSLRESLIIAGQPPNRIKFQTKIENELQIDNDFDFPNEERKTKNEERRTKNEESHTFSQN
jgi:hypothetical protein